MGERVQKLKKPKANNSYAQGMHGAIYIDIQEVFK